MLIILLLALIAFLQPAWRMCLRQIIQSGLTLKTVSNESRPCDAGGADQENQLVSALRAVAKDAGLPMSN